MQKLRVVFSLFVALGAVVGGVIACGDDKEDSTFGNPAGNDASTEGGPGFQTGDSGTGNPSCQPRIPTGFEGVWTPPTPQKVCSNEQLGGYYDNCILTAGGPDAGSLCQAWIAANGTCGTCIENTENTGAVQWYNERKLFAPNIGGCLAITRNEYDAGACPAVVNTFLQCQIESCKGCEYVSAAQFAQAYPACTNAANSTGCKDYAAATNTAVCAPRDGGAAAEAPCRISEADRQNPRAVYVRIEKVFCGL